VRRLVVAALLAAGCGAGEEATRDAAAPDAASADAASADAARNCPPVDAGIAARAADLDAFETRWAELTCERIRDCCLPGTESAVAARLGLSALPADLAGCTAAVRAARHAGFDEIVGQDARDGGIGFVPERTDCLEWAAARGCDSFVRTRFLGDVLSACRRQALVPQRRIGEPCHNVYACTASGFSMCLLGMCSIPLPDHTGCGQCPPDTWCDLPPGQCNPRVPPCGECRRDLECAHGLPCLAPPGSPDGGLGTCTLPAQVPRDCRTP